jgi:SAM-dependent methyltransferase
MHLRPEYGEQYKDGSVAAAYHYRPPYPDAVFPVLARLVVGEPRFALDVGCGTGEIARHLVEYVDRVDAVDFSEAMVEEGKRLPGGDSPRINWIVGRVEDAPLNPPYGVVVAGMSLHCMDWDAVLPRICSVLMPGAVLAIVNRGEASAAWHDAVGRVIARYVPEKEYGASDIAADLERQGLFVKQGEERSAPVPFAQPLDKYVEAFHSTPGLSRERMKPEEAAAFDADMREALLPYSKGGMVEAQIVGKVVWGLPAI